MQWSDGGKRFEVRMNGSVTFTDDLTDVQSLSDGGSLTIRDWTNVVPHTIEIASERGRLTRSYWVAGMSRLWGDEPQRRLAEILPQLVRNSGAFAESRVKSILAKKGVAGVLDEIGLITSDYARRVYYVALLDNAMLDSASLATLLQQAGQRIKSDYDRREILVAYVRKHGVDAATRDAFFTAVSGITSDYDRRQVLTDVARVQPLGQEAKTSALQSVGSMRSDYDRAETLLAFLRQQGVDAATRQPFVDAANRIRSTYDQNRVLAELARVERR